MVVPLLNIRLLQQEIHQWANETFPDRAPEAGLAKLVLEEIPEVLTHLKEHGPEGIGGELADCFILLLDMCSIWGVDAAEAIEIKMRLNHKRQWKRNTNGMFWNHTEAPVESEGGEP